MTLSTIDHSGQPDARVLILKDVDQLGWYFASSCKSKKGEQLEFSPFAAMTFYWSTLGKQIRIKGKVIKMDEERCAEDFLHRGKIAKAIALLGNQSQPLINLAKLASTLTESINILDHNPQVIYPFWTLYCLQPTDIEFLQADTQLKHTRVVYSIQNDQWSTGLLWP